MIWIDLLIALLTALLLSALFVSLLGWGRRDRAEGAWLGFFLLVFVLTWAGGLWVTPFGPTAWGTPWLSFLLIGLIVAIVLAAAAPPPPRPRGRIAEGPEEDPRAAEVPVLNWFFWTLLLVTGLVIVLAYV